MGNCTSSDKRRQRDYKRVSIENAIVFGNKQLSPVPLTIHTNQRPHSLLTDSGLQTSFVTDSNSLIQLYSSNLNNNNNNTTTIVCMSSSNSNLKPRIPVSKSRLPVHQSQSNRPTASIGTTNPTSIHSTMTTNNRVLPPTTTGTRIGFIPRPTAPGLHQAQASLIARSRSISPSSNSSSSSTSTRANKTQTLPRQISSSSTTTTQTKPKLPPPSQQKKQTKTTTNESSSNPPTKTDLNTIRDRYKTQTRMNFFTRRTQGPTVALKATAIQEEKSEQSTTEDIKSDSAYASITLSSQPPPPPSVSASGQTSSRQRQRASSTLSSSSLVSDVLNRELSLDDDNCSLKSDDLLCDYDDTLTFDSVSKNDGGDTSSSNSLSIDSNKKPSTIPTKQVTVSKDNHRSSVPAKVNDNVRESLDELTRLSTRFDNTSDHEQTRNRLLSRSVSLKPPASSLPPREDAEQIIMDIESYRQVMKDVMVVKTVLHQLDRLLKHSDGTNMTDSMIGSFHESMISSRHYSMSSAEGNPRSSIDENSTYDDLMKEILILRKERDQDKQTIKLLQEQMYKYSSQANDS